MNLFTATLRRRASAPVSQVGVGGGFGAGVGRVPVESICTPRRSCDRRCAPASTFELLYLTMAAARLRPVLRCALRSQGAELRGGSALTTQKANLRADDIYEPSQRRHICARHSGYAGDTLSRQGALQQRAQTSTDSCCPYWRPSAAAYHCIEAVCSTSAPRLSPPRSPARSRIIFGPS